jgi:hypothetical protein
MSTGSSTSSKLAKDLTPRISDALGLTGMTRNPIDFRCLGTRPAGLSVSCDAPTVATELERSSISRTSAMGTHSIRGVSGERIGEIAGNY